MEFYGCYKQDKFLSYYILWRYLDAFKSIKLTQKKQTHFAFLNVSGNINILNLIMHKSESDFVYK